MTQNKAAGSIAGRNADHGRYDAVIVGAGFAGLYMLYRLRKLGMKVKVFEAGDNVGGTWYWNRYPGARCDVESMEYSYSFSEELQQEWHWSERYATQPEILKYIHHVADRFDLRKHIQLDTRVDGAEFDPGSNLWTVTTSAGDAVSATFCVMATGCLSTAKLPEVAGLDSFRGKWYHTGFWPKEEVDLTGQRVAVIGTGSSGIQLIPQVAKQAKELYVFQRTANYSLPARNAPLAASVEQATKQRYPAVRKQARESPSGVSYFNVPTHSALAVSEEERRQAYEARWVEGGIGLTRAFNDVLLSEEANRTAADFVRGKIRGIVKDPKTAELLTPTYRIGTKRLCADTEYFQTYNRPNVKLVDIKSHPVKAITPDGVSTTGGDYPVDAIIFATGFDAMTGTLLAMDIHVKGGATLRDQWEHGPRTYLGIMTAGLPNLFMITAPGSPSVLSNVVVSIEQHVDWITDCLTHMQQQGLTRIAAEEAAQDKWVAHVNEVADQTLLPKGASWYVGANVPGKPRVFMPYVGGVGLYRQKCAEVAQKGYPGFKLTA
ncbi:MAG: NAD(P)/FAD-dependent oxidoreductase [Pseudomonadota bacterium]